MNTKRLYEYYHRLTKPQSRVINKNNFTYKNIITILERNLPKQKNIRLLDIGCGSGTLSLYFASMDYKVTGIDISDRAIKACRKSAKALSLKNVDFEAVDFPNKTPRGKYDFIIFSEVIEHLSDDMAAIKKVNSLLNPNGILFLSTPSKNAPLYKLRLTKKFDREVGHLRRYTIAEITNLCKSAGFKIVETKKEEGILRNFLFINPIAGKLIRFIKFYLVDIVTFLDKISLKLFGESDLVIIAKKI